MEVRQLNQSNVEEYLKLRLDSLKYNPESFSSSYEEEVNNSVDVYKERLKGNSPSITLGAFKESKLVGIVTLVKENKLKLNHRINLVSMYVVPEQRELGVGKALVSEAIKISQNIESIEQIYLSVAYNNQSAKGLYKLAGFENYGIEKRALKYEDDYFDIEHMVLFFKN